MEEDYSSVEWTLITHVCKQWRDISVNLPKLWTRITFDHPKWTEEMLIRSQNLDLIISVSPGSGSFPFLEKKWRFIRTCLKSNIARVEEIDIHGPLGGHTTILDTLFPPRANATSTRYAPRLTSLRLKNCLPLGDTMTILDGYFVYANNLKVLEVSCTNHWDSRLFMNLTHLKVNNPDRFERPSAISFYSALKRMPLLQSLELRGAILPDLPPRDRSANRFGVAPLRALKTLILVDDASVLPILFAHVSFPAATSITIRCSSPAAAYTNISDILAGLPTIYTPLNIPVQGLRLDITKAYTNSQRPESLQVDFDLWSNVPSSEAILTEDLVSPFKGEPFLSFGLSWKTTAAGSHNTREALECRNAIAGFFLAVPCKNLSVLSLTSSEQYEELPVIEDAIFQQIFNTQPALHTVFVSGRITHMLLRNLMPPATYTRTPRRNDDNPVPQNDSSANDPSAPDTVTQGAAAPMPKILFPNLHTLSIADADFIVLSDSNVLCYSLMDRVHAGCGLETLSLSECNGINDDVFEVLGNAASNFVWHDPIVFKAEAGPESEEYSSD